MFRKRLPTEGLNIDLSRSQQALAQAQGMLPWISSAVEQVGASAAVAAALHAVSNPQGARAAVQRMLDYSRSIQDQAQRSLALLRVAEALGQMGEVQVAMQLVDEGASGLQWDAGGPGRSSSATRAVCASLARMAEDSLNASTIGAAYDLSTRIVDTTFRIAAVCDVASAFAALADIDSAQRTMREAEELAARTGEESFKAAALQYLAKAYDEIGDRERAAKAIRGAVDAALGVPDSIQRSMISARVGFTLFLLGEEQKALELLRKAAQWAGEDPRPERRVAAMTTMAAVFARLEAWQEASRLMAGSLGMLNEVNWEAGRNSAIVNMIEAVCESVSFPTVVRREIGSWGRRVGHVEDQEAAAQAMAHLRQAQGAWSQSRLIEALRAARQAQNIIQTAEYEKARAADKTAVTIQSMDTMLEQFRGAGVGIAEFESRLAETKRMAGARDFQSAALLLKELETMSQAMVAGSRPEISVSLGPTPLVAGTWSRTGIVVENRGRGKAKRVEIVLEGPVEVQGVPAVENVAAGGRGEAPAGILAKQAGTLPLKATVRAYDAFGSSESTTQDIWAQAVAPGAVAQPVAAAQTPQAALHPVFSPSSSGVAEERWRETVSTLPKATVEFDDVPMYPKVIFETLLDVALDAGYSSLEPRVSEAQGLYRGVARLHRKNLSEGAQIEVASAGPTSKVIIRAFSYSSAAADAERLAEELNLRFDLKAHRKPA